MLLWVARQVWIKPLSDGTFAVALINKDETSAHDMVLKLSGDTDGAVHKGCHLLFLVRTQSSADGLPYHTNTHTLSRAGARSRERFPALSLSSTSTLLQVTSSAGLIQAQQASVMSTRNATSGTSLTRSGRRFPRWMPCCSNLPFTDNILATVVVF